MDIFAHLKLYLADAIHSFKWVTLTVDLVIFPCLDFCEFVIFRLFAKFIIRELSI